ncbi:hypothetical protein R6Q59_033326 [Mikania micrantha]
MMHHFTHSKHPIALVNLPIDSPAPRQRTRVPERVVCQKCDFQLHISVVYPPLFLNSPPSCSPQLVFYSKPKQVGFDGRHVVWANQPKGLCSDQLMPLPMHPCCAMLSDQINYPFLHTHPLNLLPADNQIGSACRECNRKRSGRLYGCRVCDYHLHAVCAKDLINGLKVNGSSESPTKLGPAVRFASQVVFEFFGGLLDGIGEGVGQALVQNVTRSAERRNAWN